MLDVLNSYLSIGIFLPDELNKDNVMSCQLVFIIVDQGVNEQILNSNSMIFDFCFQSLRILKNSDLKPYIVFIAAPNIDKLRTNRIKEKVKFTVCISVYFIAIR